jgi:Raf kinase inhibitor-like YbhB/YbcL family protein
VIGHEGLQLGVLRGGRLPERYTGYGAGLSSPLRFSGVPTGAAALAVIVTDPDAPSAMFTHGVVFDLPPHVHELASANAPSQARRETDSAGTIGYTPPCPPSGTRHYRFTPLGLRDRIELPEGASLDRAIQHIWAEALLGARHAGRPGEAPLTAVWSR